MAAVLPKRISRPTRSNDIVNYRVEDGGHTYRVCCSAGKRVLTIMRRGKQVETVVKHGGRRWWQVLRAAETVHGIKLRTKYDVQLPRK